MGNRANLVLKDHNLSIYLHWNGGPESVAAFLAYGEEVGLRHDSYYPPRLAQIIGNFFGGTTSLGLSFGTDPQIHADNGIYTVWYDQALQLLIIDHNGRKRSLPELIEQVQQHPYWKPNKEDESILDNIRSRNAEFFGDHEHKF